MLMNNIAEIVAVDWVGSGLSAASHPLFGELQTVYETVLDRAIHHMQGMQPSQILTASGNALADLSADVLKLAGFRAQVAEVLGISHPDFDGESREVHEILRFVCIETLGRYHRALMDKGYDAAKINEDLQGVKSGAIRGIEELARLSNKYEKYITKLIKIAPIKPPEGWASLRLAVPPQTGLDRLDFGYR